MSFIFNKSPKSLQHVYEQVLQFQLKKFTLYYNTSQFFDFPPKHLNTKHLIKRKTLLQMKNIPI